MDEPAFCYRSNCSTPGCRATPRFKVAAAWISGPLRELKTYGLACDEHRDALLDRARGQRRVLHLSGEEEVGPVQVYLLAQGRRDNELPCLAEDPRR
ncbi:hypothetical protein TA3x_000081 [Tundrisphaera sp. TA3]|uniref:hypothetical protein n=1 Tax=Tundrisphaera sp. TA3 TaxID=3435775 RepID=UPI003EBB8CDE